MSRPFLGLQLGAFKMYFNNPTTLCNWQDVSCIKGNNIPNELCGYVEINNEIIQEDGDEICVSIGGKDVILDEYNKPVFDENGELTFKDGQNIGIWMTPEEMFDLGKTLLFVASAYGFNESDKMKK